MQRQAELQEFTQTIGIVVSAFISVSLVKGFFSEWILSRGLREKFSPNKIMFKVLTGWIFLLLMVTENTEAC